MVCSDYYTKHHLELYIYNFSNKIFKKMSTKHLTVGSVNPPKTEGLLRIYAMKYCPYVHRPLLVLKAKNIPHDIVNINLTRKPEWYFQIHPQGKVPTIIDGAVTMGESIDVCYYLDEKYPEPPLSSSDPAAKAKDKELIAKSQAAQTLFFKCLYSQDNTITPEQWTKELLNEIQYLEKELVSRNTPFFGGQKPGMVDYMMWPFAERAAVLKYRFGKDIPFKDTDIPVLRKWAKAMSSNPVCKELFISGEDYWAYSEPKGRGDEPPYDG